MSFCNTLDEVREYFSKDRFATENGITIEAYGHKYAKCSLYIESRHKNAMGALMGGATFTLADFTFAVATNWDVPGTVSLNSNISFCGTVKGDRVISEAKCIKDGRSTCCYLITITDNFENLVATVMINGFKKQPKNITS